MISTKTQIKSTNYTILYFYIFSTLLIVKVRVYQFSNCSLFELYSESYHVMKRRENAIDTDNFVTVGA
jgi:hypothetical protein